MEGALTERREGWMADLLHVWMNKCMVARKHGLMEG